MLLLGDAARNEDAQMSDGLMNGIDNRLTVGSNLVDAFIKVEYPSKRLLGWRDVVALRAEHHDRGSDVAKINRDTVRGLDLSFGEMIADEQLIDDRLDLLGIQIDVPSPPLLKTKIARRLGVDLGIEVVLLSPQRIRRILVLEILYKPRAIELTVAKITRERCEPAAAQQSARVPHRILAMHAGPVRKRRTCDNDRTKQFRANGGDHHDCPSGLAISNHTGLAIGARM